jgi:cell division protein FtsB
MPETMTLEQALDRILELQESKAQLEMQNQKLSEDNETLATQLHASRERCQDYFNKLSQQFLPTEDKNDDETEVPSCEEFAKSLNII